MQILAVASSCRSNLNSSEKLFGLHGEGQRLGKERACSLVMKPNSVFLWQALTRSTMRVILLYIGRIQQTAALMWDNGSSCLLSEIQRRNFIYYCLYFGLQLTLDQHLAAGIFLEEGMCSGVSSSGHLFYFYFFKRRLTCDMALSGLQSYCSLNNIKQNSLSVPKRRLSCSFNSLKRNQSSPK